MIVRSTAYGICGRANNLISTLFFQVVLFYSILQNFIESIHFARDLLQLDEDAQVRNATNH